MDKLTIEQKAQRYDEAIEVAKRKLCFDNAGMIDNFTPDDIREIFPELKKPEDEEIRKGLIENFKWFCGDYPETAKWGKADNLLVKDILAWLEKQNPIMAKSPQLGEQKPAWSEKDEEMFMSLYSPNFTKEQRDWLKSLKDRIGCELNCTTMWKPSEKQMEALEHFVRSIGESGYASPYENNTKLLYSLLEQLKKL